MENLYLYGSNLLVAKDLKVNMLMMKKRKIKITTPLTRDELNAIRGGNFYAAAQVDDPANANGSSGGAGYEPPD